MNDKELHKLFRENKFDVPDKGFSKKVMQQLPGRNIIWTQIIIIGSLFIGLCLTFIILGTEPLVEIGNFITAVNQAQVPGFSSIIAFLVFVLSAGTIGYALNESNSL